LKLYAICYGKNFKYGTYGSAFRDAEELNRKIEDFSFLYYLAEYDGIYTLIDTGFRDEKLALDMGVTLLDIQKEMIKVFGKLPQISKVILTHNHWDHVGNLDLYPEATVIMSRATYHSIMEECKNNIEKDLHSFNIVLVDSEQWIDNKFHFEVIGGHTPDSSVLYFEEAGKQYVITGDECYLCANAIENRPIGISFDKKKNEEFIKKLYLENWIPLPFHDGDIMNRYPKLSENIAQIVL